MSERQELTKMLRDIERLRQNLPLPNPDSKVKDVHPFIDKKVAQIEARLAELPEDPKWEDRGTKRAKLPPLLDSE